MKWLKAILSPKPSEPKFLTPQNGERILDIVSEALQRNDYPYTPRSALKGVDVFQVDSALKLRVANDFLLLSSVGRGEEIIPRAQQWSNIPTHVLTLFADDEELKKLEAMSEDSPEYHRQFLALMPDAVDEKGFKDPRFNSLETLDSFVKYCMYIGPKDPLYWQKIYTRIDLPYGDGCPKGNEPQYLRR